MTTSTTPQTSAPQPGSPEYNAAMAAKFREGSSEVSSALLVDNPLMKAASEQQQTPPQTQQPAPVRPDNVPEKFWDAEKGQVNVDALLQSYVELERGATTKAQTAPPEGNPAETEAQQAVANAGLDWDALGDQISSTGTLDDASFTALEKVGVPRDVVERYISGLQAEQKLAQREAFDYAGGEQATNELLGWAAQNLSPDRIRGFNQMLAGADWKVALDTLKTLRTQANPAAREPNLIVQKSAGQGAVVGYATEDERNADMRNPLYRENSPAGATFRAQVMEKVRLASYRR